MERKIEIELLKWKKSNDRLPLIVHGARQVGKTYILTKFAKDHYRHFIYLNFEANAQLHTLFDFDLDPHRIIRELSVMTNTILSTVLN